MKPTPKIILLLTIATAHPEDARIIRLDATSPGRVFNGVRAVSARTCTRLLPDYPEPQRSQVLGNIQQNYSKNDFGERMDGRAVAAEAS